VKRTLWLCSLAIVVFSHLHCDAAQEDGATQEERADAVKWASEEPGHVAKRFLPGIDYPAVVRRCLDRDPRSFRHLFALSAHADAAASDLQAAILAIVLKQVGDEFFAGQVANATKGARESSIELLRYELLDQTPTPYGIDLRRYPKMARLLERSNQSMKPTAPSRSKSNAFTTIPCRGLSLSR
jgi:hypothetical protein